MNNLFTPEAQDIIVAAVALEELEASALLELKQFENFKPDFSTYESARNTENTIHKFDLVIKLLGRIEEQRKGLIEDANKLVELYNLELNDN